MYRALDLRKINNKCAVQPVSVFIAADSEFQLLDMFLLETHFVCVRDLIVQRVVITTASWHVW